MDTFPEAWNQSQRRCTLGLGGFGGAEQEHFTLHEPPLHFLCFMLSSLGLYIAKQRKQQKFQMKGVAGVRCRREEAVLCSLHRCAPGLCFLPTVQCIMLLQKCSFSVLLSKILSKEFSERTAILHLTSCFLFLLKSLPIHNFYTHARSPSKEFH